MTRRVTALALLAALPLLFGAPTARADEAASGARASLASTAEGTVKQLPGGAILRLAPGTQIETLRTMKLQLAPPGSPQTVTQVIKLVSGRVDIEIPLSKSPKTAVLVQAPYKVSAVAKGGHSIAIADANSVTLAAKCAKSMEAAGWRCPGW